MRQGELFGGGVRRISAIEGRESDDRRAATRQVGSPILPTPNVAGRNDTAPDFRVEPRAAHENCASRASPRDAARRHRARRPCRFVMCDNPICVAARSKA